MAQDDSRSSRPVRIAAFSGAGGMGDDAAALGHAVRGEPVDVLIGDYMAEWTMAKVIAGLQSRPDPLPASIYHCADFLALVEPQLQAIADQKLKVVVNAGAFDPPGLAGALRKLIADKGLPLKVAHVFGDDMMASLRDMAADGRLVHLDTKAGPGSLLDRFVAANAYMGGWGIAAALEAGSDIVICGRVSDASLVLGPAAWWHGWAKDDWNKLAAAVAAGHVIECGAQSNGGNFAGFMELSRDIRLGYPIAEIAQDGEVIITKRPGEGGHVTVDTVTAQLLYEIQGIDYLNPDVVLHMDSIQLSQDGPDRVKMRGITGGPAPDTTKIGCFYPNGWRMHLWAFAVGLDIQDKIDWLERQLGSIVSSLDLDDYRFEPCGQAVPDPQTEAAASVPIRLAVAAQDKTELFKFVRGYSSFSLAGLPGFHGDGGGPPEPRVEFWPGVGPQADVKHQVVLDDGRVIDIPPAITAPYKARRLPTVSSRPSSTAATKRVALGDLVYARSGDKGANASLGIWCKDASAWDWVNSHLDEEAMRSLLSLRQDMDVERHLLPNMRGVLFVLKRYFGESGSGNIALDPIGKAVGEFVRARMVDVPADLVR